MVLTTLWKLDAAAEHAVNTSLGIDCIEGALWVAAIYQIVAGERGIAPLSISFVRRGLCATALAT